MSEASQKIRDAIKDLRERTDRYNWDPGSSAWHRAFGEISGFHHALSIVEVADRDRQSRQSNPLDTLQACTCTRAIQEAHKPGCPLASNKLGSENG